MSRAGGADRIRRKFLILIRLNPHVSMNGLLRLHYQRQLIYAGLDDFAPNEVFPTYLGGRDGNSVFEWKREVVTFLERGVELELLEVKNWKNLFSLSTLINIGKSLLVGGAQEPRWDENVIWNSLYFCSTRGLVEDLALFGLLKWEALTYPQNIDFLKFIQNKYQLHLGDFEKHASWKGGSH